jgi:hypothetical protein
MLTTMATALLNAIPGESPETRLAAFAERLGAVYEGSCWRMSPAVRETLRDAAVALALEPREPVDGATDSGWEAGRKEFKAPFSRSGRRPAPGHRPQGSASRGDVTRGERTPRAPPRGGLTARTAAHLPEAIPRRRGHPDHPFLAREFRGPRR